MGKFTTLLYVMGILVILTSHKVNSGPIGLEYDVEGDLSAPCRNEMLVSSDLETKLQTTAHTIITAMATVRSGGILEAIWVSLEDSEQE
ncbi:hypothetical protein DAPPUDRAFT_313172 [Daphnia pulex]|uniref:Uncharacterized protein n=1 Tax=Daphnia pulex TaxID=6669 RepID=E9G327_DAPPU|nr:hypothetical protein DAPPUDRAFT_313172 [Daphnia pulex]|eukprot:EFX86143.1 hypothetical protein DAPPUDRAFT_313172 [Daphnia pulex]